VRIRIALATALAVIVVTPILFLTVFSQNPAASARVIRHQASGQRRTTITFTPMSYAQAENVDNLVNYYNAVMVADEESYLKAVAFYQTLEKQNFYKSILQQQAAAAAAVRARSVAPVTAPGGGSGGGSDATSTNTPDWACIRAHESGDNYAEGGGGAYQFELSTWQGLTGLPSPAEDYPPSVQDAAALRLYAQRGWEPWTTRFVCGL
jgi:Transglycosylase-like domain